MDQYNSAANNSVDHPGLLKKYHLDQTANFGPSFHHETVMHPPLAANQRQSLFVLYFHSVYNLAVAVSGGGAIDTVAVAQLSSKWLMCNSNAEVHDAAMRQRGRCACAMNCAVPLLQQTFHQATMKTFDREGHCEKTASSHHCNSRAWDLLVAFAWSVVGCLTCVPFPNPPLHHERQRRKKWNGKKKQIEAEHPRQPQRHCRYCHRLTVKTAVGEQPAQHRPGNAPNIEQSLPPPAHSPDAGCAASSSFPTPTWFVLL